MTRHLWTLFILFVGFAVTAAPQKLTVVEINQQDIKRILADKVKGPNGQLMVETEVQLFEQAPELKLPKALNIDIPANLTADTQYAVSHGYFQIQLPVEKVIDPGFWSFKQFQKLLPDYDFQIQNEESGSGNGRVAVPVGFTFGIAPSHLECQVQLRVRSGGKGPTANFAIHAEWGQPLATVYQFNSDCNMFFAGFLTVSSIYKLADGTAGIFTQSYLYVNDSAIEKLNKVRFLAGPPGKAIGDKIKEQTVTLAKALRKLTTEMKK